MELISDQTDELTARPSEYRYKGQTAIFLNIQRLFEMSKCEELMQPSQQTSFFNTMTL